MSNESLDVVNARESILQDARLAYIKYSIGTIGRFLELRGDSIRGVYPALLAGVAALGLALMGCSGSSSPEDTKPSAATAEAPTPAPSTETPSPASPPSKTRVVWSCAKLGLNAVADPARQHLSFGGAEGFKYSGGEVCDNAENKVLPTDFTQNDCISLGNLVRWPSCKPPLWVCGNGGGVNSERVTPCYPYERYREEGPPTGG